MKTLNKQELQKKFQDLHSLLQSETGGSTMDLIDDLLSDSTNPAYYESVMQTLSFELGSSQFDLVEELVEVHNQLKKVL